MPARSSGRFQEVAALAAAVIQDPDDRPSAARLQAVVAHYGLTEAEYRHVLSTFPLISSDVREEALRSFCVERLRS
jgi:hypothetical protein